MSKDRTTEEKIKLAAEKMFMQRGYAGTRTRDIAEEAGINLALLNYYFRSKEKLFHQIMQESLQKFFGVIMTIFNDEETDLYAKLDMLTEAYMSKLTQTPDLPMFILSEVRNDPDFFLKKIAMNNSLHSTVLYRQLVKEIGESKMKEMNPAHFVLNFIGMVVFPFVAKPIIRGFVGITDEQFQLMNEERKQLIPIWVKGMMS